MRQQTGRVFFPWGGSDSQGALEDLDQKAFECLKLWVPLLFEESRNPGFIENIEHTIWLFVTYSSHGKIHHFFNR